MKKENILGKYIDKNLGSTDITNLITELTNRLIAKGYITSAATISENNNLSTKTLNLKIISGKIEKIILNEDKSFDNLKKLGLRYNMKHLDLDVAYAKPLAHSDYLKPKKREIYFSATLKFKF